MDTLHKTKKSIKLFLIYFSVIISFALFFQLSGGFAFQKANIITNPSEHAVMTSSIREYQKKIKTIDSEILFLKQDMQWLGLKIKRMKDFNRHVPEIMEDSLASKGHNIIALEKIRKRLKWYLQALLKKDSSYARISLPYYKKTGIISVSKVKRNNAVLKENTLGSKKNHADLKTDNKILKKENKDQKKAAFVKVLRHRVKKYGLSDWVEINSDDCCCRLVTRLPILFASGSAKIANTYKIFFKKLAACIRDYDVRVIVDGYADIDPIHNKKYPSNFELGAARAANIVHELVNHGIKPSVFKIDTTGKYRFKARGMSKKKVVERRADLTVIFAV